jgi:DNA repair protein RadC
MSRYTKGQARTASRYAPRWVAVRLVPGEQLAPELTRIRGPRDVFELLHDDMRARPRECMVVIYLNTQHRVLYVEPATSGTLDTSLVHPREVFQGALAANAAAVVLAHNHPSGDPTPSAEDREVTRNMRAAGELLGIPVLDHVVIAAGRYVSFVEMGLLLPVA